MTGRLLLLGPQRPTPNVAAALQEAGARGPVAVVTAGWRHDEGETAALAAAIGRPIVPLPVYGWFEELTTAAPEVGMAWHDRQDRIRQLKRAYRIELHAAQGALDKLEVLGGPDADITAAETSWACRAVRAIDERALQRLDEIRASVALLARPWELPGVRSRHEDAKARMADVETLVIAGGHVAILLNRMAIFGLDVLLRRFLDRGGLLAAWSAGAMVLTDRIVTFYDDPPHGEGGAELMDRGFGLLPDLVVLPHARRRLRLDDDARLRRLAHRFEPRTCLAMENGAWLVHQDGAWLNLGQADAARRILADGTLEALPCR